MSAFQVSPTHLAFLVRAWVGTAYHGTLHLPFNLGAPPPSERTPHERQGEDVRIRQVWDLLAAENVKSLNARYPRDPSRGIRGGAHPYDRTLYQRVLAATQPGPDIARVAKALACYEYQSCEHDGWKTSDACHLVGFLRAAYLQKVRGYSDAPWSIDSLVDVTTSDTTTVSIWSL